MMLFNNEVLSIGDKIKKIRKLLGVNQQELACSKLDRSMISYLENNKVKLVKETADILALNINSISKQKGYDIKIGGNFLLENESEQATRHLNNIYLTLKNSTSKQNHELYPNLSCEIERLKKYNVSLKVLYRLYNLLGEHYFENYNFSEAYLYYLQALEISSSISDKEKISRTLSDVAKCLIVIGNSEMAIKLNEYIYTSICSDKNISSELKKKVLFNTALGYKKIEQYEKCLEYLEILQLLSDEDDLEFDALMLKANCYNRLKHFKTALSIYEYIYLIAEKKQNTYYVAMAYNNLGNLYFDIGELDKSLEFAQKSLKYKEDNNMRIADNTLLLLGKINFKTNNYDDAKKYFNKLIEYNGFDFRIKIDAINMLSDIYLTTGNKDGIFDMVNSIITIVKKEVLSSEYKLLIKNSLIKIANYFINIDNNYSKQILDFCLEVI